MYQRIKQIAITERRRRGKETTKRKEAYFGWKHENDPASNSNVS